MGTTPTSIYSASVIAALLRLSPYVTQFHAWQKIMEFLKPGFNAEKGYILPEFPDNAPIRWGNAFESPIIKLAEEKFNSEIINRENLYVHHVSDELKLSCHIDGQFSNTALIHEGKTTWNRAFYSIKGEDYDDETGEIEFKRRWGEPGTDEVPEEYQIQCAVQRICTGAELVKLSVLVFPKSTQEFEELGWKITDREKEGFTVIENEKTIRTEESKSIKGFTRETIGVNWVNTMYWAHVFAQIGNFHTYNLPTNKTLESLIIEKIQEFDSQYVKTELPPPATDYADIRRLITSPMGTIIASPHMEMLAQEYSMIVRELGKRGPTVKRQEAIKTEIMNEMNTTDKGDAWSVPSDKMILVSPNGGEPLITYSKSGFRAKRVT